MGMVESTGTPRAARPCTPATAERRSRGNRTGRAHRGYRPRPAPGAPPRPLSVEFPWVGYSRASNSPSFRAATTAQSVSPATRARPRQFETAALPHPTTRASCRRLLTPPATCSRRTSLSFASQASLGPPHRSRCPKGRTVAVDKACVESLRPGAARAPQTCRTTFQPRRTAIRPAVQSVRHPSGTVSVMPPESRPSWTGARNMDRA